MTGDERIFASWLIREVQRYFSDPAHRTEYEQYHRITYGEEYQWREAYHE